MSRKKIVILTVLLTIAFSGCVISSGVGIGFPNLIVLNKNKISNFDIVYVSTYSEAQNVSINLKTNDPRLGLSTNIQDTFTQSLDLKEEVGSGYRNTKQIYIKVIDPSIPYGNYKISGTIMGEKSAGLIKTLELAETTVTLSP